MKEWDQLLPHAQLTLNHLRASRRQPTLSAHTEALGAYNFDAHPLAPPGTKVLVHETSEQRGTFDFHGTEGWYVGPASDHYRCHRCYLPKSNRERIAITVAWFPQNIPIPQVSTEDYLFQTASDMLHILKTKDDTNSSTLKFGTPIFNAYRHIAQILKRATDPPPAPIIEPSYPASAPRVEPSPTQQAYQPAASAPRVEAPQPPVITNTRREVLRKLAQQSLRRSKR